MASEGLFEPEIHPWPGKPNLDNKTLSNPNLLVPKVEKVCLRPSKDGFSQRPGLSEEPGLSVGIRV